MRIKDNLFAFDKPPLAEEIVYLGAALDSHLIMDRVDALEYFWGRSQKFVYESLCNGDENPDYFTLSATEALYELAPKGFRYYIYPYLRYLEENVGSLSDDDEVEIGGFFASIENHLEIFGSTYFSDAEGVYILRIVELYTAKFQHELSNCSYEDDRDYIQRILKKLRYINFIFSRPYILHADKAEEINNIIDVLDSCTFSPLEIAYCVDSLVMVTSLVDRHGDRDTYRAILTINHVHSIKQKPCRKSFNISRIEYGNGILSIHGRTGNSGFRRSDADLLIGVSALDMVLEIYKRPIERISIFYRCVQCLLLLNHRYWG